MRKDLCDSEDSLKLEVQFCNKTLGIVTKISINDE